MKLLNFSKCLCILFVTFMSFKSIAQTWQTLNATTLGWRFEDMQFVDPEIGWLVDGGGQILKTTNGGVNWTQQHYNSDHYFRSVEFYDENIGFAGTLANGNPNATLLKTIDGGTTWTDISSNLPVNVGGICGMHMVDENTIFITGLFYADAYIMKSTNQGDTWTYTDMGTLCNALVDIYFKDENIGFASGQSAQGTGLTGIIVRTTDGGETWNTIVTSEGSNERIWKIQELNDSVLYGSVEAHTDILEYYKSIDGGLTWQLNSVPSVGIIGTIQGIGFLSEDIGWVGGFGELFYETLNRGQTWEYKPTIGTSFNRFQRVNDTLMYTSGVNLYKYMDPSLLSIDEFEITKPKGHSIAIKDSNIIKDNAVIKLNLINNTYCELSIYNTSGQRVKTITQEKRKAGDYDISFNVNSLAKGHYFVVLYTYHGYESIRIVVE